MNLYGTRGNDSLIGTSGDDNLFGGFGIHTLIGGLGNDTYYANNKTIIKENNNSGIDIIFVNDALLNESISIFLIPDNVENLANSGNIKFSCYGNNLNNSIVSLNSNNKGSVNYFGFSGNDTLSGGIDNDQLSGDEGDDNLQGWGGDDTLYGGQGNDFILGLDGDDWLFGEGDDDSLSGGQGNDQLSGNEGNDYLLGDEGNDYLSGNEGDDALAGGTGFDYAIYTGSKLDYLINKTSYGYIVKNILEGSDSLFDIEAIYFAKDKLSYNIESLLSKPNNAPIGTPTGFIAGIEDTSYTINSAGLLSGFTDADGDTLSVTNLTTTHGKITSNTDGTWLLTPDKDFNGSLQLSYVVNDNKGGSVNASFYFVLNPVNDAPIGKPTVTFEAGTEDLTTFTLKDSDYFLGFSDPDGDEIQGINIKVTNATVSKNADGIWNVKPNANFNGIVSLTYDVIDNKGGTIGAAINFVVNPVNDPPIGKPTVTFEAGTEDFTYYILKDADYLQGFSDSDGDTLQAINIKSTNATIIKNNDGVWNLKPNANFNGIVSLTYDVIDNKGGTIGATMNFVVKPANDSPTGYVNISGNGWQQGNTLTASNTLADVDGLGTITYQWLSNGSVISGANQVNYILSASDIGKIISVKANYTDSGGTAESVVSGTTTAILPMGNSLPTGNVTISGVAQQNKILSVTNTLSDLNGLGVINYQWLSNGVAISNAIQSSYTLSQADVGNIISVKASYLDALGTKENVTSLPTAKIENVNDAPIGNVTFTGSAAMNELLTASNNLADVDGLGVISYTWLRDGAAINDATQSTYTLTQVDVGKKISVKASYTDLLGTAENITSHSVIPVKFINHLPTGAVTLSGAGLKGQVLTATNTLVDTDGLGAITYTWFNNGIAIPNATQSTYKLTQIDTGQYVSVKASYVDLQSTSESATSGTILVSANQAPTGSAAIKGLSTWGTTLSITSTIKDADGIGKLSYTWQNDKTTLSTNATYTLADSDIGKQVWASVSYTDKKGNLEEVKSNVINVIVSDKASAVNDVITGTDVANKLNGLAGNDTLIGGLGKDSLTGGVGADVFKFNSVNDSSAVPKQADTITDFKHAQGDKIDLSAIDANSALPNDQAFTLISAATFSADATGQLRFDAKTSTLYGSINADDTPEFSILLNGVKSLVQEDFVLI
jgi:Ca2+-binding RTX toxin-like protein